MKRFSIIFTYLSCCWLLLSCAGGGEGTRVLKLAHGLPPSHSVHKGLAYMGERLRELSGGKLTVDIYSSAQLGSENQCIELL